MIFNEGYVGGAAAQGFDTDGARAGEDVEKSGAYDAGAEDVEKRFAGGGRWWDAARGLLGS